MSFQPKQVYLQQLVSGLVYSYRITGVYHGAPLKRAHAYNIGYIEVDILGNNEAVEQLRIPMRIFEALVWSGILKEYHLISEEE